MCVVLGMANDSWATALGEDIAVSSLVWQKVAETLDRLTLARIFKRARTCQKEAQEQSGWNLPDNPVRNDD